MLTNVPPRPAWRYCCSVPVAQGACSTDACRMRRLDSSTPRRLTLNLLSRWVLGSPRLVGLQVFSPHPHAGLASGSHCLCTKRLAFCRPGAAVPSSIFHMPACTRWHCAMRRCVEASFVFWFLQLPHHHSTATTLITWFSCPSIVHRRCLARQKAEAAVVAPAISLTPSDACFHKPASLLPPPLLVSWARKLAWAVSLFHMALLAPSP